MNNTANLALRDIHMPDPISWWPPAIGWWLILLLLITLTCLAYWLWKQHQKKAVFRAAHKAYTNIESDYRIQQDQRNLASELSVLLRRVAISISSRRQVAALKGEAWLTWLNQQSREPYFAGNIGQTLLSAPYQLKPDYDANALLRACEKWLHDIARSKHNA